MWWQSKNKKLIALEKKVKELEANLKRQEQELMQTTLGAVATLEAVKYNYTMIEAQKEINEKSFQWIYLICAKLRENDIEIPDSPVPRPENLN